MLFLPGRGIIDFHLLDHRELFPLEQNRDGQPLRPSDRFDTISISPAPLLKLYIIIQNEYVAAIKLFKKAEPRQIAGLQNTNGPASSWLFGLT